MRLEKKTEGGVKFYASPALGKGAFYNPASEFQRDISISVAQAWQRLSGQRIKVCDALSASGIRGLRYAKEVKGVKAVTLNDKNPAAVSVIKRNIKLNKLSKLCKPVRADANVLLHENIFNFIDLDPYGSPNVVLDSAARSIWHRGFLAVTATDTAPLSGVFPLATMRKYAIASFKGAPFYSELGLRTLLSYIILTLARRDRAFIPVLSHSTRHYFRCYGRIEHSGAIEQLLEQFGFVSYDAKTGEFKLGHSPEKGWLFAGPLYLGPIQDRSFVKKVASDLKEREFKQKPAELKLLKMLEVESTAPAFYYDLHALASLLKRRLPTMDSAIKQLQKKGHVAVRTHFDDFAIKTDAPYPAVKKLLR
jgi:tRNA (guanine26-N2/guanine27-N2)-dimethyltransferase